MDQGGVRRAQLRLAVSFAALSPLAVVLPPPTDLARTLGSLRTHTSQSATTLLDTLLTSAAALLGWSVLVWALIVVAVGGVIAVAGGDWRRACHRLLPRAARATVLAAVGAGTLTAMAGCAPESTAANGMSTAVAVDPAVDGLDLSWPIGLALPTEPTTPNLPATPATPGTPAPPSAPPSDPPPADSPPPQPPPEGSVATSAAGPEESPEPSEPPDTPSPAESSTPPAPAPASGVTVERGDTLWAIAAAALGPGATSAQIAEEWPRWYAENRSVIGDDPDYIRPGWYLVAPSTSKELSP